LPPCRLELGAAAARAATGCNVASSPGAVDEVIFGHARPRRRTESGAPSRASCRSPDRVPAFTVNKACGSGLKALLLGAQSIRLRSVVPSAGWRHVARAVLARCRAASHGHGTLVDAMYQDGFSVRCLV
jgi:acetyl-CoA C-acetyltransferase